jgi:hypothetical protein
VIEKVGTLADERFAAAVERIDDDFERLLAELLGNLGAPACNSRAVRDAAGSSWRAASTASCRRSIESVIRRKIPCPRRKLVNGRCAQARVRVRIMKPS